MSKITGGLLGLVSGKIADVVFSSARGRTGKINTARQKVIPANPRTTAQVLVRSLFSRALGIVRFLAASIYSSDWDRSIGQLPGFQSMNSVLLNARTAGYDFALPVEIPLGTLPQLASFQAAEGGDAYTLSMTWPNIIPDGASAADEVVLFAYPVASGNETIAWKSEAVATRADGVTGIDFENMETNLTYIVGYYVRGAGDYAGMLSPCNWASVALTN